MNNYEYCVEYAVKNFTSEAKILDYGCGAGIIVDALNTKGYNAFGCDMFYEGGDRSHLITKEKFNNVIFRMEDGKIPFPNEHFDMIISNQVMEHVLDLDLTIKEINRVLKPGGKILCLFPDKSVWREGHCGVPFLHWFPKKSRISIYYAFLCRCFGAGYHKEGKSRWEWASYFCDYIDKWTHYREYSEINQVFIKHIGNLDHVEQDWLVARLGIKTIILPAAFRRFITQKLMGLVFVVIKPNKLS